MDPTEKFRQYLQKCKRQKSIVGIFTLEKIDREAVEALPTLAERKQLLDTLASQTKHSLQSWVESNGGTIVDELAGTTLIIVSGSYTFWQTFLTAYASNDPAFAKVKSLEGNEFVSLA